ncbi:hypothetical protein E2C01_083377 [Portunus trituberculatus]|uniref:Uncharacterized protein n=1 Tax=Portunus trituberculatus TaxID=210409 RepID=A0A5B7IX15_PORTR|nr:hypothetical protein [Portunus trituberculatus]
MNLVLIYKRNHIMSAPAGDQHHKHHKHSSCRCDSVIALPPHSQRRLTPPRRLTNANTNTRETGEKIK